MLLYKESSSFDEEEPVICGEKKKKPTRHQQFKNVMLDTYERVVGKLGT